ncbi:AzlD domain-containing protein [Psychrobacter sp. YP14]|uniref:AzlD domain-containing protein n=3 Tax=Psychrobacter TaxID=497 RepID=A0A844M2M6_9GAMM|nr:MULTISPECIES: AzlD domain-containing protein [Psychrobacter]AWT49300.1 AzlD domain-containing protein [Psychrobacter sp. YP14]MUG33199.1 AzlD domain-containing protein [Psychrobacter sanguinis]UNK04618.1 AzlD domain-containing protein [Psychrobacter sp. PraFG1]
MSSSYLIFATLAMAGVTFITRALPALIPRRLLDTPWLHRLNESLPLSVMVLLILTSLSYQDISAKTGLHSGELHLLLAQIGALILVLLVYHISRQLLVSMVVGIAAVNGLLRLFAHLLS